MGDVPIAPGSSKKVNTPAVVNKAMAASVIA